MSLFRIFWFNSVVAPFCILLLLFRGNNPLFSAQLFFISTYSNDSSFWARLVLLWKSPIYTDTWLSPRAQCFITRKGLHFNWLLCAALAHVVNTGWSLHKKPHFWAQRLIEHRMLSRDVRQMSLITLKPRLSHEPSTHYVFYVFIFTLFFAIISWGKHISHLLIRRCRPFLPCQGGTGNQLKFYRQIRRAMWLFTLTGSLHHFPGRCQGAR